MHKNVNVVNSLLERKTKRLNIIITMRCVMYNDNIIKTSKVIHSKCPSVHKCLSWRESVEWIQRVGQGFISMPVQFFQVLCNTLPYCLFSE